MKFKVNVNFQGVALLDIVAENAEEARKQVDSLTMGDLARVGHSDIIQLRLAAREIKLSEDQEDRAEEDSSSKPRPSGWYRPG
jgi:hypothetical protein